MINNIVAIVFWMNQDDYPLLLRVDLKSAIDHFNHKYKNGPMLFPKHCSSLSTSIEPSSSSLSSLTPNNKDAPTSAAVGMSGAERACDEATQLIYQMGLQMAIGGKFLLAASGSPPYKTPSRSGVLDFVVALSRGTFLFAPANNANKDTSLSVILEQHIPIYDIGNIILEYLDSSLHGHGLTLIKRVLLYVQFEKLSETELKECGVVIQKLVTVNPLNNSMLIRCFHW
jgi:hypothetical protein